MTTKFWCYAFAVLTVAGMAGCNSQPTARKSAPGVLSSPAQQSPTAPSPLAQGLAEPDSLAEEEDDDDDDDEVSSQETYRPNPKPLSGVFPKPPELQPQIAFWRKVYGEWGRSQVAIHDDRHMNVIYEVVDLPGEVREGYTSSQKELVSERLDYWRMRLSDLEQKLASHEDLDADDYRLSAQYGKGAALNEAIQGASDRVRAQRGLRERFKRGVEISGRYDRHFKEIFRRAGLPEELAYLPHVESSFQANARSSAGAVGVWQFTPAAAKTFMDTSGRYDARLDPVASARGAARYLSHAYDTLGSWPLALTSYNHGIGGMKRAKSQYGHDFARIVHEYDHPQFGFASRNYYAEFLAACEVLSQSDRYFPEGIAYEQPGASDRRAVMMAAELREPESPEPEFVLPIRQPARHVSARRSHVSHVSHVSHGRGPVPKAHVSARSGKPAAAASRVAAAPSRYSGYKTVSYAKADGSRQTGYVRVSASSQSKAIPRKASSKSKAARPGNGEKIGKVQMASRR